MPAAVNKKSKTRGHPPKHGPLSPVKVSTDVFVEGAGAARKTDLCGAHPPSFTPNTKITQGSSTVAINGLPAARVGDKLDCGDSFVKGADAVNIG